MKNRICIIILLLSIVLQKSFSQQRNGMMIDPAFISPGLVFGEFHYTDTSMHQIADTLTNLIKEYGFKDLWVQECGFQGLMLRVAIYEMKDSVSAFGIYSVLADSCETADTLAWFDCINKQHVRFAKGNFYVHISSPFRKPANMNAGIELESRMIKYTHFRDFYPNKIFLTQSLVRELHNLKVMKGKLGLRKGYPAWVKRFRGIDSFYLQIMPTVAKEGPFIVSRIEFNKAEDMQKFIANNTLFQQQNEKIFMFTDKGRTQKLLKESETSAIYLDMVAEMPKPPPAKPGK
jgi:hypothetical protein